MRNDIKFYQEHKNICLDRKRLVESMYNKIMLYTSPVGSIETQKVDSDQIRPINASIYEASVSFKNFVMYSLFGTKIKWAKADLINSLLKQKYKGNEFEAKKLQIKKALNVITDDVFEYIFNSNYEKEIGKCLMDWGELGTGCWEILELDNPSNPFTNRHVPLNELLFNQDMDGENNIVFRYCFNEPIENLKHRYPRANLTPLMTDDMLDEVTVIECVMPFYKDGVEVYEYILFDSGMNIVLDERIMNYNPYNIVVFTELANTCWGLGLGAICLDSYERLNFYEQLRARQVARIVEPPLAIMGDKRLLNHMSFEPNAINWFGDGINGQAQAFPINTTGSLLPTEKDIDRITQNIQQTHFNNPFGSADNRTTRAVEEIQYRMQLLQQRFSDAVSNLYSNVLIPAFSKPKIILENRGIIEKLDEDRYFKPKFINLLTQTVEKQKIDALMSFAQVTANLFPQTMPYVLKEKEALEMVAESLEINQKLISTPEEINAKKSQAQEQQMQATLLEQIGNVAEEQQYR